MSTDPAVGRPRQVPVRGAAARSGHRPLRDPRSRRAAHDGRSPRPAEAVAGLAAVVHRVLGLLQARRGPLASDETRAAIDQLRHFAHDAPDPAVRATVHVACAHLSAGDLEETYLALSTAALALRPPPASRAR